MLARLLHLPAFGLFGYLRMISSHTFPGTDVARPQDPVLIFSHGYGAGEQSARQYPFDAADSSTLLRKLRLIGMEKKGPRSP